MSLTIKNEPVPLATDREGVLRVGGTRVTLDTVIAAFKQGAAAEEIVYRYPTLILADVYAVISFYLRRKQEVDEYLKQRQKTAEQVRKENQARFDSDDIRNRLLARQANGSKKMDLKKIRGKIKFSDDYDYKSIRGE